jgi:predicted HicB family RNase H-like nuclease
MHTQIGIRCKEDFRDKLKIYAIKTKQSMNKLIIKAIQEYLEKNREEG